LRLQLLEPLRPTFGIPQKSHRILIMHDGDSGIFRASGEMQVRGMKAYKNPLSSTDAGGVTTIAIET
jgi:hypothetical protein